MFEDREQHLLDTLARRLRRARGADADSFDVFNAAQDHVVEVGRAHVDRVVLEAFVAGIEACADPDAKRVLGSVCDLYVLHRIEADKAWFLEHGRLTPARSKAVTERINTLCRQLRPLALDLVGGFGIPHSWLAAAMLDDPGVAARG
jgi:acyl-CoA oxidase